MNNLLCREEKEKCSYDAGRKEWLGGRHIESQVQRKAKNVIKAGGWNSQDLYIGSAEATDWKNIPEGLWLQHIMSEHGMNLKYRKRK